MFISGMMPVENAKHLGRHWHTKQMKLWIEWKVTFPWKLRNHCPWSWKHVGKFISISSEHFATGGTRNQTVVMTRRAPHFQAYRAKKVSQKCEVHAVSQSSCVCVCVCICLSVVSACCPFQVLNLLTHFHEIWYEHYPTGGHFTAVDTWTFKAGATCHLLQAFERTWQNNFGLYGTCLRYSICRL